MTKNFILSASFFAVAVLAPKLSSGTVYTVTTSQNWSAFSPQPTSADSVKVKNNTILTVDVSAGTAACIQLGLGTPTAGNGTLRFNSGKQVTVGGAVVIGNGTQTGTIDMTNGGTLIAVSLTAGSRRPRVVP